MRYGSHRGRQVRPTNSKRQGGQWSCVDAAAKRKHKKMCSILREIGTTWKRLWPKYRDSPLNAAGHG